MKYLIDVCLLVGFTVICISVFWVGRFRADEESNSWFIRIPDVKYAYLWLVWKTWLIFFLALIFSLLAGAFGGFISIIVFVLILSVCVLICVGQLLSWILNPNPFDRLLGGIIRLLLAKQLLSEKQKKGIAGIFRLLVDGGSRKSIWKKVGEVTVPDIIQELHEGGQNAKNIMDQFATLKPVLGAMREATKQSKEGRIVSLQKDFIVGFLATFLILVFGLSSIAWNLHILNIYELVDRSGKEVNSFLQHAYFTMITISTVGYGDISPGNDFAKAFAMIEIFAGFFLIVIVLASFANVTLRLSRIPDSLKERRSSQKDLKKKPRQSK